MAILPRFPPRGEDELLFPFLLSAFIFPLIFYLSRARARFFDRANLFNGELLFQEELLFGEKRAARGIRGGGWSINRDAGSLFLQRRSGGTVWGKKYVRDLFHRMFNFERSSHGNVTFFLND